MAEPTLALLEYPRKAGVDMDDVDADFLREGIQLLTKLLMELEVTQQVGAERYQPTVLGPFAQAIISDKIKDNSFGIKTDKPNVEVSWQLTGVRQDPYARAHPIQPEQDKSADQKGKYLHPTEFDQPEPAGVSYETKGTKETNETTEPKRP